MAHEDDVKIARAKAQYDQIPEDTKDPNLIRMKKKLKKKIPSRRANEQYWSEEQFQKVIDAPSRNLVSQGNLPWRLLAYLLQISPDVGPLFDFAKKRLLTQSKIVSMSRSVSFASYARCMPGTLSIWNLLLRM